MRKKGMKAISIMLTASIVLSSPGAYNVVLAAPTDSVVVETAKETATEDEVGDSTTEQKNEEDYPVAVEEIFGEKAATTASVSDAVQKTQESTAQDNSEKDSEPVSKKEDPKADRSAFSSDKIVKVITDVNLQKAIIGAYKSATGSSKADDTITFGDLRSVTGTLDLSSYTGVTEITAEAFVDCSFTAIKLPSSVKVIREKAFSDCKSLESIDLPDSLTTLEMQAFSGCEKLTSVNAVKSNGKEENTLPSSLTTVGYNVFLNDESLTEITIPNLSKPTALQNADGLFQGCKGLSKIIIKDQVSIIPASAFASAGTSEGNTGVTVTFGNGLTQILSSAFLGVAFAEGSTLDFSKCTSLVGIASRAFEKTENLTKVVFPVSTTGLELGDYAFACTALSEMDILNGNHSGIYLPDYIKKAGSGCFYGNETMTSVSLSPNLSTVSDYMFDGCSNLSTVEQRKLNNNCAVTVIADCAFRGTAITNTDFMLDMNNLKTIGCQEIDNASYGIGAGVWDGQRGDACYQEAGANVVSLPAGGDAAGVTNNKETNQKRYNNMLVGSDVFSDCPNLTSVKIPSSVISIGSRAFCYYKKDYNTPQVESKVVSIEWQSGSAKADRVIYAGAFQGNKKLTSIVLPYNVGDTLEVGSYAFAHDEALSNIGISTSAMNNVLPATVTSLGTGAFFRCKSLASIQVQDIENQKKAPELGGLLFEQCTSLTNATLPASLTEIPRHCFYNVPLTVFNVGPNNSGNTAKVTKIGNAAFFGNQFETVDLSKYTGLREIGAAAFAFKSNLNEFGEEGASAAIGVATTGSAKLKSMILPDKLVLGAQESKAVLFMNTEAFYGQTLFDTMKTPSASVSADTIYIPDYVTAEGSRSLFAETGVSAVKWQADMDASADKTNLWKDIPVLMYRNCKNIREAAEVLPAGNYVKTLGKGVFHGSSVETVTLTSYTNLEYIGSLKVDSSDFNGTFRECLNLRSVKLPKSQAESFSLGLGAFYCTEENPNSTLTSVDLGNVTTMEEGYAFSNCKALEQISFPLSLKKVGEKTFWNCSALTTVDFGAVEVIGMYAFQDCDSLVLTEQNGLPDSLVTIDTYAFYKTKNPQTDLGTAVFGSNITSIGYGAFENSGLSGVDFTTAEALTTISGSAFKLTNIKSFSLVNSPVQTFDSNTLAGCPLLTEAEFGEKVGYIAKNAICGCPSFKNLRFAATTTVNPEVFYNYVYVNGQQVYTAQNTTNRQVTITVDTPSETLLPLDYEVNLPYYINESGQSNLKHILISYDDEENSTVQQHLKVSAKLADGYFWGKAEKSSNHVIQPGDYYEKLTTSSTAKYNNHNVDVIKLKTLKAGEFKFTVSAEMQFSLASGSAITSTFSTRYNINVKEMEFYPELYKEKIFDDAAQANSYRKMITENSTTNIQGAYDGNNGCIPVYYQIKAEGDALSAIDTYDIVVKTDRPDILFPCLYSSDTYSTSEGYRTEKRGKVTNRDSNGAIISVVEEFMYFRLAPKNTGIAHITVYPEGHERFAKTYTFRVDADINSITLEVPAAYKNGASVGDTFSVFSSYTTFFNQVVDAKNLNNMDVASNRDITYTSSEPGYVSVDSVGNVKILKADTYDKDVLITAVAQNTKGTYQPTSQVYVRIKGSTTGGTTTENPSNPSNPTDPGNPTNPSNPGGGTTTGKTPQLNETVEDTASKTTSVVTKTAENGNEGEVTITKTSNTSSTVTIPDYVMVNGVKYKVTSIASNVFAGNKKLKEIYIGANVTKIEDGAFSGCTLLTKVTLPASVVQIGAKAFSGCKKLKTVTIPSNAALTEIGNSAFQNCKALTKITIPDKVTKIGNKAFYNCSKLKTVTVKTSVLKSIGSGAFQNCKALTKIVIPAKVTKIGSKAFCNCSKLKTITVKTTVLKSIGSSAFKGIHKKAVIKVPKKKLSAYKKLFKGKGQKKTVKIKK